jgi:hypothetical protein
MADEGGGVAVLGGNLDLLVDHGVSARSSVDSIIALASDTIARKPQHDKATGGTAEPRR